MRILIFTGSKIRHKNDENVIQFEILYHDFGFIKGGKTT